MRNIVIFLLVMNLGYFVWTLLNPSEQNSRAYQTPIQPTENNLVLLSELDSAPARITLAGVAQESQDLSVCLSIGDFADSNDAGRFRTSLASQGVETALDVAGVSYRVYLPPFSSRGIASIILEAVNEAADAAGLILGSSLIDSGELENGIAFGVFNTRDDATVIQSQLANLGYTAGIDEGSVVSSTIRVFVRLTKTNAFDTQIWPQIVFERPYLNRTENLCETIAQGAQFP
ncbi:MAG: hypothetical protein JKY98_12850 [Gammaproteobacteria bacterium]|nr:hypothetical protein [Gammaproteobacteria bacterium]